MCTWYSNFEQHLGYILEHGPVADCDIPNCIIRDQLIGKGFVERIDGLNIVTGEGLRHAISLGIVKNNKHEELESQSQWMVGPVSTNNGQNQQESEVK